MLVVVLIVSVFCVCDGCIAGWCVCGVVDDGRAVGCGTDVCACNHTVCLCVWWAHTLMMGIVGVNWVDTILSGDNVTHICDCCCCDGDCNCELDGDGCWLCMCVVDEFDGTGWDDYTIDDVVFWVGCCCCCGVCDCCCCEYTA